jgi:hypothetical protein
MVNRPSTRTWDVVIIDATGRPADCSLRMRAELLRLGLRVQLHIVPAPSASAPPLIPHEDLKHAAYSVILRTECEDDGTEVMVYLGIPAPRYPGQMFKFAPMGTQAPAGSIETGRMGDVTALADRIAERLRAG